MDIVVTQENFARALSAAARVASGKTQLPILSNILLQVDATRLLVAATNLEIATTQYIGAKVNKPGSITVPAKLITEFVSNLPKESIELKVVNSNLHIKCGHYTSIINGTIADDFPELPTIAEDASVNTTINLDDFKQAVSQTILTASSDATRPVLTGVYWHSFEGHLYLAATDGYRLSERRLIELNEDINAIIPMQTLQEVLRIITDDADSVDVLFDDTQVRFRINEAEVISRLIDGNFPDYRQLIPKESETTITLDKQEFSRVVKIAGLFARESGGSIILTAEKEKGTLSLHSVASEVGENTSDIAAKITKDGKITLSSRYLTDALSVVEGEVIEFSFSGKLSPCIIKSSEKNTNYYHVIMPLRS